jgi:hypothetical protein
MTGLQDAQDCHQVSTTSFECGVTEGCTTKQVVSIWNNFTVREQHTKSNNCNVLNVGRGLQTGT